ncbi:DUF2975 domain-containing protein [Salinimicrobium sp. WS361]|uniref:DUF2975 domain-containing protein n=1 Tax=Salinimicrobium sp. WS361 TaxID=3425123 RepID=UPI003D6F7E36
MILLFLASLFLIYVLAGGSITYPYEVTGEILAKSHASLTSLLCYFMVITGGYLYFFNLLRQLAQSMGGKLFTQDQVKKFKQAGRLLILLTIIENFFASVLALIFEGINMEFSFADILLFCGFGSFLLILGEVFARGRFYKEENELTV